MKNEKPPTTETPYFPAQELKAWIEETYKDSDTYGQELKNAHIRAIEDKNIEGLKKLSRVMFVQISRLRQESKENWEMTEMIHRKLDRWLEQRGR
ncbi:MAG: hypothetical protein A3B99_04700 [Candidatus Yanofskybacteria bacterium RIFCSPHIGHO2_02_FULL_44_12b]|uniref:Uncharacterized protein n=2 Tax=Candidatus Yanofskyibacteriota TaxID=1752733 RepID=A0A1F8GM71_9BACT|nr:MAG: hypothetical protein UW79_C0003G0008 [Candidatus Yanofskybacteria bacterium GW2011_GWA2_44_9]OGN04366.1 MAG: hypothetical protein A2659_03500 [Candidatus Yanofskybacteria bacterium RIFCSPHIGHO2_01_FULL_44_24]OGN14475.1 MAG: hypothetical protein A3B99_04700 [Candidatus Yanofskybacteria bacterium RIFCSPHIGHO2_02_FULL_44_12b]OGN25756.1 MAG: hypothetical protein A2925_01040 [Candidatus Yanofskybacteria bacterium RIFCSPLOWO2_01_FULL_44_22]